MKFLKMKIKVQIPLRNYLIEECGTPGKDERGNNCKSHLLVQPSRLRSTQSERLYPHFSIDMNYIFIGASSFFVFCHVHVVLIYKENRPGYIELGKEYSCNKE